MGKASELKALWQLSFLFLPFLILGIIVLPISGAAQGSGLKLLLILAVYIAVIIKSEIDKRRSPSLRLFFKHVQSIMLAILLMIVLFGLLFLLDYNFEKWTGLKSSYSYLVLGIVYAIVCFLVICWNPPSVQYFPWILIFPYLLATLLEGFDPMCLALLIPVALASALGHFVGRKRDKKLKRFME